MLSRIFYGRSWLLACLGGYYSDGYGDKCSPCPAGTYLEQSPLLVQSVLLDLIPPVNQILAFLALQEHI